MLLKYSDIKQKDVDYMKFILKNGVVTANQLQQGFNEKNLNAVYRCLRKLIEKKYIKHEKLTARMGVYIGTKAARNITESSVTVPGKVSLYTIKHDLMLTDLALYYESYFKEKGIGFEYQSEKEIRYEAYENVEGEPEERFQQVRTERLPDIIFNINDNGTTQKIWVELELAKKQQHRLEEKFNDILLKNDFYSFWYFTDTGFIKNGIERAKSGLPNGDKIEVHDIPEAIINGF